MKRLKAILKRYYWVWIAGGVYGALMLFHIECPIRALTGIPCAGCGMTRAYLALLRLDIRSAFYYHPLFWLVPVALVFIFVQKGPLAKKQVKIAVFSLMVLAFIIVYIVRLFFIKDSAIYTGPILN